MLCWVITKEISIRYDDWLRERYSHKMQNTVSRILPVHLQCVCVAVSSVCVWKTSRTQKVAPPRTAYIHTFMDSRRHNFCCVIKLCPFSLLLAQFYIVSIKEDNCVCVWGGGNPTQKWGTWHKEEKKYNTRTQKWDATMTRGLHAHAPFEGIWTAQKKKKHTIEICG